MIEYFVKKVTIDLKNHFVYQEKVSKSKDNGWS